MGFGFNLFVVLILFPLSGLLLATWLLTRRKFFGKALGMMWLGIFAMGSLSSIIQYLTAKIELQKKDYYGKYIINRDYFPGKQSDWQYENFRFEINDKDSILFHVTKNDKILRTYRGTIKTKKPYSSEILTINMEQPTHHIMKNNPTIYRSAWSFYLVFYSSKFNNVYFKKGNWKPLDK